MVGSSQSIATPNTYLNVATAQVLSEFADKLEKASDKNKEIQDIIKESYSKHNRVVYNGNGYSEEWVKEAERRGLPNIRNAVDSLTILTRGETIQLFERHGILTEEELESRYHIYLEKYAKQVNIEAGVTVDIARRQIFPAAASYAGQLAKTASALAAIGASSTPQEKRARRIADLSNELFEETEKLENVLTEAQGIDDPFAKAKSYFEKVRPAMDAVRCKADSLEKLSPKAIWPLPGYEDMLFKL
jgi:glutamine synthetase